MSNDTSGLSFEDKSSLNNHLSPTFIPSTTLSGLDANVVDPHFIYPEITNYIATPTNVLLIDKTTHSYQTFIDSANASTFPVVYSNNCSINELLSILRNHFTTIERIGFCFVSYNNNVNLFLDNQPFFDISSDGTPEGNTLQTITEIIREFSIKNIDFLACDTLKDSNWQKYYDILLRSTGVIVGASDNKTGNIKYGGDWIMESTSQDIESVYFTKSIEYYTYLLDVITWASVQGAGLTTDGIHIYSSIYGDIHKINISTRSITNRWVLNTSYPGVGTTQVPYDLYASAISGNYIYVRSYSSGTISKISLTNPYGDYSINWLTSPKTVGNGFGFDIFNGYMYISNNSNIHRINISNTNDYSLTWATSAQGIPAGVNTVTIYNGYLYAIGYSNGVVSRVSLTNPTTDYTASIATLNANCRNMICVNGYLYATSYNTGKISRLNLSNYADVNTNWRASGYQMGITTDGLNIYAIGNVINQIDQITIPLPPIPNSSLSFDSINTKTVSSGNLQVSIIDTQNTSSNGVYYLYSTTGDVIANYINSGVLTNGPSNTVFYIPNLLNVSYTIYVKASNIAGNSTPISRSVIVYQTPRQPSSYTVSSSTSGNINISVTETTPPANYNLNEVTYWYYLYTTGTNQFANVAVYSLGASMNSSYTTNFVIQNLSANYYRVYVLAKNSIGNSSPFLSTNANVSVFTTPSSPNSYSLSFDVATGITVSVTDTRNVELNQVYYHYYYYRVGDTAPNQSTDINVYANSYVPVVNGQTSYSFNIKGLQASYYNIYIATKNSVGGNIYSPVILPVNVICFKEDSRILTNRGYRKIQYLKKGDLIKTFQHGFKPIYKIGKKDIIHVPSTTERGKDRLYKCSSPEYPEVFEDLVLTGCHSILVDDFVDDEQRNKTKEINGGIYVTDKKYRLPVCADYRATVYEHAGKYAVYHIALENDDYYMNYGIYANGLLVESTSKRFLDEYKVMETQSTSPTKTLSFEDGSSPDNTRTPTLLRSSGVLTIGTQYSNLLIHQQKY
jgi:hypothetical protein